MKSENIFFLLGNSGLAKIASAISMHIDPLPASELHDGDEDRPTCLIRGLNGAANPGRRVCVAVHA